MKLAGFLMFHNESRRANLRRCLDNLSRYCDVICCYDDGSTDDSYDVAREYTPHVLRCEVNDFAREQAHRGALLQYTLGLEPDWIFWLDADEVLDRNGTEYGLREMCDLTVRLPYEFEEVTLWRSQTWRRLDYLGRGRFNRLWPVHEGMRIPIGAPGLHQQLHPIGMGPPQPAPFRVLHYGYSTREAIIRRWRERTALGVPVDIRKRCIDERGMQLERVPRDWFPPGCEPPADEPRPEPIEYGELA